MAQDEMAQNFDILGRNGTLSYQENGALLLPGKNSLIYGCDFTHTHTITTSTIGSKYGVLIRSHPQAFIGVLHHIAVNQQLF